MFAQQVRLVVADMRLFSYSSLVMLCSRLLLLFVLFESSLHNVSTRTSCSVLHLCSCCICCFKWLCTCSCGSERVFSKMQHVDMQAVYYHNCRAYVCCCLQSSSVCLCCRFSTPVCCCCCCALMLDMSSLGFLSVVSLVMFFVSLWHFIPTSGLFHF